MLSFLTTDFFQIFGFKLVKLNLYLIMVKWSLRWLILAFDMKFESHGDMILRITRRKHLERRLRVKMEMDYFEAEFD